MFSEWSPLEITKLVWKRRAWMIFPVVAGLALGLLAAKLLPPVYRARTVILIESPRVPAHYVTTTVTTSLQERLQTIEQQITRRGNVERVPGQIDLDPDLVADGA